MRWGIFCAGGSSRLRHSCAAGDSLHLEVSRGCMLLQLLREPAQASHTQAGRLPQMHSMTYVDAGIKRTSIEEASKRHCSEGALSNAFSTERVFMCWYINRQSLTGIIYFHV